MVPTCHVIEKQTYIWVLLNVFRLLLPYFIWYAFHELGGKIVHSIVDEWPKATVT